VNWRSQCNRGKWRPGPGYPHPDTGDWLLRDPPAQGPQLGASLDLERCGPRQPGAGRARCAGSPWPSWPAAGHGPAGGRCGIGGRYWYALVRMWRIRRWDGIAWRVACGPPGPDRRENAGHPAGRDRRGTGDMAGTRAVYAGLDWLARTHIRGFSQLFPTYGDARGSPTSILLYRTVMHVQNGARRQLRALGESPPGTADAMRPPRVAMTSGSGGLAGTGV